VCRPRTHRRRFLALWTQIAERYAELPSTVRFELLNEPHGRLTGQRWNDLMAEALAVVRDGNPHRDVIVGPAKMNTIAGLDDLELPDDDRLLVTPKGRNVECPVVTVPATSVRGGRRRRRDGGRAA
jgi:hypothetical protein